MSKRFKTTYGHAGGSEYGKKEKYPRSEWPYGSPADEGAAKVGKADVAAFKKRVAKKMKHTRLLNATHLEKRADKYYRKLTE